jgi:hypothetical protein
LRVLSQRIQNGDVTVAVDLKRLAHEIQGKGGVFGFPAISACAGDIKDLAGQLLAADPGHTDDLPTGTAGVGSCRSHSTLVGLGETTEGVTPIRTAFANSSGDVAEPTRQAKAGTRSTDPVLMTRIPLRSTKVIAGAAPMQWRSPHVMSCYDTVIYVS